MENGAIVQYYPANQLSVNQSYNSPVKTEKYIDDSLPYEIPGCPLFGIFLATVTGAIWLFISLTLSSYHYARVVFPVGNYLDLNFGLWTLYVSSNCNSIISFNANKKLCTFVVSRLNNLNLTDATNFICYFESILFQILNLGCNEFHLIRQASAVLIILFSIAIILLFFSSMFLLTFWFCYRTIRVRQTIFMLLSASALVSILGLVAYLLIGGLTVQPFRGSSMLGFGSGLLTRNWFVDISRTFDLSSGFAFACFGMIWVILLPLWAVCILTPNMCVDYEDYINNDDTYSDINALMTLNDHNFNHMDAYQGYNNQFPGFINNNYHLNSHINSQNDYNRNPHVHAHAHAYGIHNAHNPYHVQFNPN